MSEPHVPTELPPPVAVQVRRACILTGGGDAPGLNAVVRGFVRRCHQRGIEAYGSPDGFEGLIEPGRVRHLSLDSVRGILDRGGSVLGAHDRRGRERETGEDGEQATDQDDLHGVRAWQWGSSDAVRAEWELPPPRHGHRHRQDVDGGVSGAPR